MIKKNHYVGVSAGSSSNNLDLGVNSSAPGVISVLLTPKDNNNASVLTEGQLLTAQFKRVATATTSSNFTVDGIVLGNSVGVNVEKASSGSAISSIYWGPNADNEGDGIPDYWDIDDDNVGMPDSYENANGLNPFINDAGSDNDNDGVSNYDEYRYGLDPWYPSMKGKPDAQWIVEFNAVLVVIINSSLLN